MTKPRFLTGALLAAALLAATPAWTQESSVLGTWDGTITRKGDKQATDFTLTLEGGNKGDAGLIQWDEPLACQTHLQFGSKPETGHALAIVGQWRGFCKTLFGKKAFVLPAADGNAVLELRDIRSGETLYRLPIKRRTP